MDKDFYADIEKPSHLTQTEKKAQRRARRDRRLEDLKDGRKNRSETHSQSKGKGSYKRKNKYGDKWS